MGIGCWCTLALTNSCFVVDFFIFPLIEQHQCVWFFFKFKFHNRCNFLLEKYVIPLFYFILFSYFHKITNIDHKKRCLLVYCPITQLWFMPLNHISINNINEFNLSLGLNDMKGFQQCFGSNFFAFFLTLQ